MPAVPQCICTNPLYTGEQCERDRCAGYCANKGHCYQNLLKSSELAVSPHNPPRDRETDRDRLGTETGRLGTDRDRDGDGDGDGDSGRIETARRKLWSETC